jgi:hypothetical protein
MRGLLARLRYRRFLAEPDRPDLDGYEDVLPGARRRLLVMRAKGGSWAEVGDCMRVAMERLDRELRHEVPGWPFRDAR